MILPHSRARKEFLEHYESDLNHVREFYEWKRDPISHPEYEQSLYCFLDEFRVLRCICKKCIPDLLKHTSIWLKGSTPDNVDDFATYLKANGLTHGKTMTSMASKILFLNHPQKIFPIDRLARQAVGLKTNRYRCYQPLLSEFVDHNRQAINTNLATIESELSSLESEFKNEIQDIETVRLNRYVDKLLWAIGSDMIKSR